MMALDCHGKRGKCCHDLTVLVKGSNVMMPLDFVMVKGAIVVMMSWDFVMVKGAIVAIMSPDHEMVKSQLLSSCHWTVMVKGTIVVIM